MTSVLFRTVLLGISVVLATSCGGGASFSPTAPSRNSVGGQTGAVIVGQVNDTSAPVISRITAGMLATAGTFATADSASIMVRVLGTDLSTTTNGQGQFMLTGVPPGEVRLEFTGPGGRATISISGVSVDEEIRISITLNGSNAHVDSEHRNRHDDSNTPDQIELRGAVSGLTGTCPKVSFTVQSSTVTATETTQFEDVRCADIKNGTVVEVRGSRESDGSITATKVEGEDEVEDGDDEEDEAEDAYGQETHAAARS